MGGLGLESARIYAPLLAFVASSFSLASSMRTSGV